MRPQCSNPVSIQPLNHEQATLVALSSALQQTGSGVIILRWARRPTPQAAAQVKSSSSARSCLVQNCDASVGLTR